MRLTSTAVLAMCLLHVLSRSGAAQTIQIQEKIDATLALKRAGALVITGQEGVRNVSLSGIKAADQLLDHVKVLSGLESLEFAGTNINDNSLEKIKGLTSLKSLNLASTKVGNKGLEHLRGLTRLTELSLFGTQVNDEGLEQLKALSELRTVIVNEARVTSAGASILLGGLPKVTVIGAK